MCAGSRQPGKILASQARYSNECGAQAPSPAVIETPPTILQKIFC